MADVNANIGVHIDTSGALAELKNLQRQLATFHSSISKSSAAAAAAQKGLQTNLLNAINATGKFHASMGLVRSSTESFTHALETNKLSMREYFRYAGGSTRTFGRLFKQEFDTIGKVAEERVKKMQTQYIKMGRDANGAIRAMAITPTSLNMKDYATQAGIAAQKQAILNQLLKQGSTNLLNFGKNTQWAGRQLMVGFTIPLAYFGSTAAKTFMDLEAQAIKFKRVYGDMFTTTEQTNKALDDIKRLAEEFTKYGVAVSKTMEMAAEAAAMGKTGAELTAQVAGATRLAVLGGVEQSQALETTISVTNAFGIAADQLAQKIDFLNAVENQTVVSIADLTEAIPKAGPVIKQLGGSVEDLAFFLTAMKEGGINASEGANALKSGLASLINPTKAASEMLAGMGINIKGIVEANAGNIRGTVIGFAQALDQLAPLQRARAIEQLFGKFQFARLSTLFQNITKDGTQASRVLQLAGASVEELAIISERELGTVENAVGTNFKESIEKLKLAIAPIGKTFLEAVTPIVKVIGNLLDKFNNLGDGTKKFIVIASTLVGVVGPVLLMTFGLLANGVANIIKLFITMRAGFLRAGTNTNILAQQTGYLNAEQLESATVAASLNQAHTTLTQSFSAETSAVNLLRQAYIDATIAAANFARANPGMMMPGRGGKIPPKKFARGATYVPGTGNKDTVPSMLTPGEAVIPAPVAQDPKFQPIIDAMVNGKLQGFNGGTTGVNVATKINDNTISFDGKVFSPVSKSKIDELVNKLNAAVEADPNRKQQLSKRMTNLLDPENRKARGKEVKPLTPSNVQVSESRKNKVNERTGSDVNPEISKARRSSGYRDPITGYTAKTESMSLLYEKLRKAGLSDIEAKNFTGMNESHIQKSSNPSNKWFEGHVVRDVKGLNNYLNRLDPNRTKPGTKGSFAKILETVDSNPKNLPGITRKQIEQLKKDFEFVKSGRHPITPSELKGIMNLAIFDERVSKDANLLKIAKVPASYAEGAYQAKGVRTLVGLRAKTGYSFYTGLESLALGGNKNNPSAIKEPINLGERINKSLGHGGGEIGKAVDGEYRMNDKKVFVKAFETLDNAKAEMKANALARNLHGLVSPQGQIRMIQDPNNPGRKIPVLISEFDSRFTEESMKKQKFNSDNMVKQLVASALRGDKDVKVGNMSGNYIVDPGNAYIYDKASGVRTPAKSMASMQEMIEKNLRIIPGGGASKDFSNKIEPLMNSMTAEEFNARMKKEVNNLLTKADKALSESGYSPSEAAKIKQRLKTGLDIDFKTIHNAYLASRSVAVKPGEVLEKDGKIKPIKTIKKPKGIKTASPKDTLLTPKENAPYVRNVPRNALGMKPWTIGRADAPFTKLPTNQPMTKLSSGLIIPASQLKNFTQSLQDNTESNYQNTKTTDEGTKTAKEQKREARAARAQRVGRIAGPVAGIAGTGAMAAYMSGNAGLGNAMLGVSAISSILPMITSPMSAAVAALVAGVAGIYFWNKTLEQSAKKQAEFVRSTSGTTKKMAEIGKITGTVGASQIMAKKRETGPFGKYNDVQRAGQMFGDSFVQSDVGKTMVKGFVENMKQFGSKQAASDFALQLSTYVSDGVLTNEQAKGIAEQIGIQLGSNKYTLEIQGDLRTILGPNGENLAVDPLRVRTQIIAQAGKRTDRELAALAKAESAGNSGRTESAKIAALAASNLEIIRAQADATNILYDKQINVLNSQLQTTTNLQKQLDIKQQIASLESKQAVAAQTFNTAYADRLSKEVKTFKDKIQENNTYAIKGSHVAHREDAYFDSLKASVKDAYKGTAMESMATDALSRLAKLSDKTNPFSKNTKGGFKTQKLAQAFEVQMSLLLKDQVINPEQSNALLDLFAGKLPELQQTLDIGIKRHGPEKTVAMLDYFTNLDLDPNQSTTISTQIVNSDPRTFNQVGEALASLQALDGHEVNMSAYIETAGYEGLVKLGKELDRVEQMPTPITKESIIKYFEEGAGKGTTGMTKDNLELLMSKWADFDALPDSIQKEAISKFLTIYQTEFKDEAARLAFVRENAAQMASSQGLSSFGEDAVYNKLVALGTKNMADFQAEQTKTYIGDLQKSGGLTGAIKDAVDGGKRPTYLDDLLKRLKLTRDAAINAVGGLQELRRVMAQYAGDIKIFKGVDQQLRDQGMNQEFINFVSDLDPAIQKKFITIKDGIVSITKDGKDLAGALNEAIIGELQDGYRQQVDGLKAQSDKFIELKASGLSAAEALSIVTNEQVALALASGTAKEEIDVMVQGLRDIRAQEDATLKTINPAEWAKKQIGMAQEYYDVIEKETRNVYQPQIDAVNKLIDANEKLIETKQREVEMNYDRPIALLNEQSTILNHDISLIDKAAEEINKKYDDQEKALTQVYEINSRIAEQEKGRLSIANALTEGDIAAAARALQDERQAAAQAAQDRTLAALQSARDAQIAGLKSPGGLTKVQIEQKLYDISEQVYALEQKQIPLLNEIKALQDANYNYQVNSIAPLQAKLDKELEAIDVQRKKWNDIELSIDGAKVRSTEYKNALNGIVDTLKTVKGLWDEINASSTKTTPTVTNTTPTAQQFVADIVAKNVYSKLDRLDAKMGYRSVGGIIPKYFASGGFSRGTDTIPAMLTAGEYVIKKSAVDSLGVGTMNSINNGNLPSGSVYNYSLNVNVGGSNSSADDIARAVMSEIKRIDSQRVRGVR